MLPGCFGWIFFQPNRSRWTGPQEYGMLAGSWFLFQVYSFLAPSFSCKCSIMRKILPSFFLLCSHKSLRVFPPSLLLQWNWSKHFSFYDSYMWGKRPLVSPPWTRSDLQPNEGSKPADMLLQLFERRLGLRRAEDVITLSKQKSAYWGCHIILGGVGGLVIEAALTIRVSVHVRTIRFHQNWVPGSSTPAHVVEKSLGEFPWVWLLLTWISKRDALEKALWINVGILVL